AEDIDDGGVDGGGDADYISQDDCWAVISAFFRAKGLVRQQLDSFNEFIQNTIQEIVDENGTLVLETNETYSGREGDTAARLRNLTYSAPLYADVKMMVRKAEKTSDGDTEWVIEQEDPESSKIHIGDVPIMLRSEFCILSDLTDEDLPEVGECPFDQGGYFVINGSEKVLIAQERMASNHVYVFAKAQPATYAY
ncbi:DNA-dependent RNA polymerase II, partial [Cladochytrium tenue]